LHELKYMPRKQIDNRPVRRKRSVRSARRLTLVFLLGCAIVLGMILSGWVRWKQMEIVVLTNQLQEHRGEVLEQRKQLLLEVSRLKSPERISKLAEGMGMIQPEGGSVIVVKGLESAGSQSPDAEEAAETPR
jgi:cell division protein FtsL